MTLAKGLTWAGVAIVILVIAVPLARRGSGPAASGTGRKSPILLYCAAGIKPPVAELAARFEREFGVPVQLQYGGSGTLLANLQIARNGDLYLAADTSYLDAARKKGLIAETLPLALMRPVIVVRTGNPKGIRTLSDLLRSDVRVALGNPDAASIGRQTRDILETTGLWNDIERRVREAGVFMPTVPEIANNVMIGAVDAGVVWDATANQYPDLEAIRVPECDRHTKDIAIGVLTFSRQPTQALRFARYLNSRVGNEVFRALHYEAVAGDDWAWEPEMTFFCGAVNRRSVESVIRRFEQREGVRINTVYNGCGILTGQMRTIRQETGSRGFPDTYMACDRYYLNNVIEWFQEDVDVSTAAIVIAVPKGNPRGISRLDDLAAPGVRVAVGQPQQCTIGALTRILFEKEGIYSAVMSNVVMQTASSAMLVPTVATRSVDAAVAYITDTIAESNKVDTVRIFSPHARAVQPYGIARSSRHKHLGRRLFDAIACSRSDFEQAGFEFLLKPEPDGEQPASRTP